jgi:hypothetical protein
LVIIGHFVVVVVEISVGEDGGAGAGQIAAMVAVKEGFGFSQVEVGLG